MQKSEAKRPLARPGHREDENFKMYLKEIRWEGVDWSNLAHCFVSNLCYANTRND